MGDETDLKIERKPDFSGYATKAGLKCTDGRTIESNAFQHQDGQKVPLVWQHTHGTPTHVLGYAILENVSDGVLAHGYFNNTEYGQTSKELVRHGDVTQMSIYANQLVEKAKSVLHGAIKEVSLVLSGANPGAKIDPVSIMHADGEMELLDEEAIVTTGLELMHTNDEEETKAAEEAEAEKKAAEAEAAEAETKAAEAEAEKKAAEEAEAAEAAASADKEAEAAAGGDNLEHADGDTTVADVYNGFSEDEKNVVHYMIGVAVDEAVSAVEHSDINNEGNLIHQEGTEAVNLFETGATGTAVVARKPRKHLSHDALKTLIEDAKKPGMTLKDSVLQHAEAEDLGYGIEDIDILFPDAQALSNTPEIIGRRTAWVADVISGTKHSPFSRVKSTAVDLTADEARAKGYVKGALKKDEIIKLLKRVTTPTTVYKKQKLDRDDILDIKNLDVVAWLKAEMRLMLDEEIARAVLIGDGRESDDEDKIDEDHIRPIAWDDDMYSHKVTVQSNLDGHGIIEAVLRARTYYKGTGTPTFYTTDSLLTDLLLLKDKVNRRLYESESDLAAAMRVSKIVTVEVMEDVPDVLGIMVNLADYTLGTDAGGEVSMFDDFDIDYNQFKYLIETRLSGALTKPKSAVVVRRSTGTSVTPTSPSFNGTTNVLTIPSQTGVVYKIDGEVVTGNVTLVETTDVEASPANGYSFPHNTNRDWTFVVQNG